MPCFQSFLSLTSVNVTDVRYATIVKMKIILMIETYTLTVFVDADEGREETEKMRWSL